MSTEYGHHAGWVYISQDGDLVVPSSARVKMEAGGHLQRSVTVTTSTAPITIDPNSITAIRPPKSVMVHSVGTPKAGDELTILMQTSAVKNMKIRFSSSATAYTPKFMSSACVITFTSEAGRYIKNGYAVGNSYAIKAHAESTARWSLSVIHQTTTLYGPAKFFTVSTST